MDPCIFFQERVHLVDAPFDPRYFILRNVGSEPSFRSLEHFELLLKRRADLYPVLDQIMNSCHRYPRTTHSLGDRDLSELSTSVSHNDDSDDDGVRARPRRP